MGIMTIYESIGVTCDDGRNKLITYSYKVIIVLLHNYLTAVEIFKLNSYCYQKVLQVI